MRKIVIGALASVALFNPALVYADTAPATTKPGPAYGTFGFDIGSMDKSVAPGDDFQAYAVGGWINRTQMPSYQSRYGTYDSLRELSKERTRAILKEEMAKPGSKIGDAYASYLDLATVEARGLSPIKPWIARIKGISSQAEVPGLLAEALRNGIPGPFGLKVWQDFKDPEHYALYLQQGGLGMPDRDYYLSDKDKMVAARQAYVAYMARMFDLLGEADGTARAQAILAMETQIAKAHWTRIERRDQEKAYNPMTPDALNRLAPGFDFAALFRALKVDTGRLIVSQPSAMQGEAAVLGTANLSTIKDMMIIRSLNAYAEYLPEAVAKEVFAFNGTTLTGTPERQERSLRAVGFTDNAVADEVSKIYVARYFPPETKAAVEVMVRNIIAAMGARIDKLTWMTPATKVKAREKLAAFTPMIGYPDRWKDYTGLVIKRDDLFGNAMRVNQFQFDLKMDKLGKPIDRLEWEMTPMAVNAYADFNKINIVFPAGIMQPPFFDPKADAAVNYGALGRVIGHEMSHHFDDQGAKVDKTGKLAEWWTKADRDAFNAAEAKLVAQYDSYEALPGEFLKGKLTLGENSADLAGLTVALDAYHRSLGGKPAPVIDGFTGDQRFFLGFAQLWRTKYRTEALRQTILTDVHSPHKYRAWMVRNLDAWYAAFGIKPTDKMYLKPEDRVRIW